MGAFAGLTPVQKAQLDYNTALYALVKARQDPSCSDKRIQLLQLLQDGAEKGASLCLREGWHMQECCIV